MLVAQEAAAVVALKLRLEQGGNRKEVPLGEIGNKPLLSPLGHSKVSRVC